MSLREQLQSMYDRHGRLTPSLVVDEARDAQHPLHDRFEWDDSVAGELYRVEQARHLIKSVKVYREVTTASGRNKTLEVRAFHAIPTMTPDEGVGFTFLPVEVVEQSADLIREVESQMRQDLKHLQAKYKAHHALFASVAQEILDLAG